MSHIEIEEAFLEELEKLSHLRRRSPAFEWQGKKTWDFVRGAELGSWGGHAVWAVGYDDGGLWVVTWGILQYITWDGFMWACDEAHTPVSQDYRPQPGFDLAKLQACLPSLAA